MKRLNLSDELYLVRGAGWPQYIDYACGATATLRTFAIYSNPYAGAFCAGWGVSKLLMN